MSEPIRGTWGCEVIDAPGDQQPSALSTKAEALKEYCPGERTLAIIGWDGFILFDEGIDLVDMARAYMEMVQDQSCGKCVPCRMGTRVAAEILARIADGKGKEEDLETLRNMGTLTREGSLCELGRSSMVGVLEMIERYEDVFRKAIVSGERHPRGKYHIKVTAPCIEACPERLDIPKYIEYIKSGRYTESLEVIQERNPLAAVCGRVCVRFCEFACRRGKLDNPVSIKHLKRFVSDVEMDAALKRIEPHVNIEPDAPRVAVVGAGPAGMTAAYHLLRKGYHVDIFEANLEPGGMAALGIPDYRLPRSVLRTELEVVQQMGAQIYYGQRMGSDFALADLRARGYAAVFLAIGAQLGTALRIAGEEQNPVGYHPGVSFLRSINLGEKIDVGRKAVVVGGGNVAMDCARSALRLGVPEVVVVYRRDRESMPADKLEVHDAEQEGVHFEFMTNPTRIITAEGRIVGLECVRMALGEPDVSGRRRPEPVAGSEFILDCDMVVPAIGQRVDTKTIEGGGPNVTRWGTIEADPDTLVTGVDGVFAGGDCVSGPATLIEAMASGMRVSNSIDQYIREGHVDLTEDERMSRVYRGLSELGEEHVDGLGGQERHEVPLRDVADRVDDFDEVEMGLTPEDALLEADRCLRCYRIILVATTPAGDANAEGQTNATA